METKILLQNDPLWNRLQNFSLDTPNVDFPFSKKLAKEENWSSNFTQKAIEEYKKFVYLCCTLPNGASPSDIVDKVWHMHLMYTQNYWEEFCPNILKQKLHHHPSNGGYEEKIKHTNWFDDTLTSYYEVFRVKAPDDIWLDKKGKPKRRLWLNAFKVSFVLSGILILISCSEHVSDFLTNIIIIVPLLFLAIFFLSKIFSKKNDPKNHNQHDGGDSGYVGGCGSDHSSGDSSSCGSSCGGGCGGCGGGD